MRDAVRRQMRMRPVPPGFLPPRGDGAPPRLMYIHVPFCETLCPYCSFHRVPYEPGPAARYFQALRREIELYAGRGYVFDGVYVGGGTPTVLPAGLVSVLECVRALWPVGGISVEAHPRDLVPDTVAMLRDAGIDRLSVGVQTFDDELLSRLSRRRGPGAGRRAREVLQRVKGAFGTVNVDMIYNVPGQTFAQAARDIETLLELGMDQVTFYPLMEGHRDFRREFGRPDRRREKALYRRIAASLEAAAYRPVSCWCFARGGPGADGRTMTDEYIAARDEYAGLGSGAFGFLGNVFYANTYDLDAYTAAVSRGELPVAAARAVPEKARLRYDLLMRLFGGVLDLDELARKYGEGVGRRLWRERLALRLSGAAVRHAARYTLTPRGRYYQVVLMREFFSGVNRLRAFLRAQDSGGANPGS
jgi:coproporphyrinogen III oxidase-like Fe-S oxidoreductase